MKKLILLVAVAICAGCGSGGSAVDVTQPVSNPPVTAAPPTATFVPFTPSMLVGRTINATGDQYIFKADGTLTMVESNTVGAWSVSSDHALTIVGAGKTIVCTYRGPVYVEPANGAPILLTNAGYVDIVSDPLGPSSIWTIHS